MKTITFKCETVTPIFLGGADGRTAEFRTPSFKGLMRFWWRAMNCLLTLDEMKEREVEIFGGGGEKGSRIAIRLKNNGKIKKGSNIKDDYGLKWRYDRQQKLLVGEDSGIGYLLYSTFLGSGKSYIKDAQSFEVSLRSVDSDALKQSIASFWSLAYLGGIGSRVRRGAGSILVTDVEDEGNILREMGLDFLLAGKDSGEIADWLIRNYEKAKSTVNDGKTRFISEYSNLSISRFIISNDNFNGWKDALDEIGNKFMDFRMRNKGNIFSTTAFGLPRKHVLTNKEDVNRRASPLIFKVLKSKDNRYYWMVLRLAGEFLPKNVVLKGEGKAQRPTYEKVDEFWNELKKHGKGHILSIPDTLDKVKKKIRRELSPKKIILFGSKARGDFHKESDIDIAVDTDKTIAFLDVNGAVDIVKLGKVSKSFKEKIEEEGIEL